MGYVLELFYYGLYRYFEAHCLADFKESDIKITESNEPLVPLVLENAIKYSVFIID